MSAPRPVPSGRPPVHVRDVPERERFEATLGKDGELAGFIEYRLGTGRITLIHTEVLDGFEGQGIGSRLVRAVLAELRERELPVVPRCPFIVAWLQKRPEEQDILYRPLAAADPGEPSPA